MNDPRPDDCDPSEAGSISGLVVDAGGAAVTGAVVMITESPEPHEDIAAVTAEDGRVRFARLPPGAYRIAASAEALGRGAADVVVEPGAVSLVEIRLDA